MKFSVLLCKSTKMTADLIGLEGLHQVKKFLDHQLTLLNLEKRFSFPMPIKIDSSVSV